MHEVNELKKNIDDALENLSSQADTLKNHLNALDSDGEFKGQTATNVKNYNESYHIETITRIESIKKEFENSFKKSISDFESEVDDDKEAIIVENALNNYKKEIKNAYENIEESKSRMNAIIAGVHDLTKAQTITQRSVKEKGDAFHKQVKETLSHFEDFQASHDLDAVDLLGAIYPVVTMSKRVRNQPANRAKISGMSSRIDKQYKMNSQNNPFVDLSNSLKGLENAVYGGKQGKKVIELVSRLKNYIIIGFIAGDGDFQKGNALLKSGNYKKLGSQKIKLINNILNTDIKNIQGENIMKAFSLLKNKKSNMKMSKRLSEAYKLAMNDKPLSLEKVRKIEQVKTGNQLEKINRNKYYKDAYDPKYKKLLKKLGKGTLDSFVNPNIQNVIKDPKNIKKYMNLEIDDFKELNKFGKSMKGLKYASKLFAPVGAAVAIGNNFATEKTMQKKLVGSAVDLGAMAGAAGTGTMIGAAIGGPIGAGIGAVMGAGIGAATEYKLFGNKSLTDIAKDKANKYVSEFRNSDTWKQTKKGISNVAKSIAKNSPAVSIGRNLCKVF